MNEDVFRRAARQGNAGRGPGPVSADRSRRPLVVVVGGGFAGMNAAHALRRSVAEVTLVDKNNYHTFQPLLYQVSTGYLPAEQVGAALRSVFRRQRNLTVRVAVAASVDWEDRRLGLADGSALGFDYLILATGAQTNFFGITGMAEHAWPLYTLADAVGLRTHLLGRFEQVADEAQAVAATITAVVVGGGPTGVETAGALATMAREVVGPIATLRVILVEADSRLLSSFSLGSSQRALNDLRGNGVDVRLGRTVETADADGVTLDGGERIQTGTVIWAAGVKANGLGAALGLPLTRHGRVVVDAHLQVPDHPNVFIVGDLAAAATPQPGAPLPMLAPVAIQSGRYAGEQVARAITGEPLEPFRYRDKGMLAVLGRGNAVAELPLPHVARTGSRYPLRFAGFPAWLLWAGVHIVYLIGFRNRSKVLIDWGWSYVTSRGAGAILVDTTEEPDLPPHDRKRASDGL
jgi:NADH dehydrogenase